MPEALPSDPSASPRCNICGASAGFLNPDRGKEGFHCGNCSATSRNRLVMWVLGRLLGFGDMPVAHWPRNKALRVLEPCPRGPQVAMLQDKFSYITPEFDPEKIAAGADPKEFADVQDLGFADESFDVVIASDVFEHVRDDRRGFREIYRVLKPGGVFLLTVPYDHGREKTLERVRVDGDRDILLTEARYAGGGGATLDYREYGRDLADALRDTGFAVGLLMKAQPRFQIYPSAIFVCARQAAVDISPFVEAEREPPAGYPYTGWLLPNRLFLWYKFNLKSLLYFLKEARRRVMGE